MSDLVYLASPYSKFPFGRDIAYRMVAAKAAKLMLEGHNIFCPIAHSHAIEVDGDMPIQDGDFWLRQDFAVLKHCSKMLVYKMPGWENSYGVAREVSFAKDNNIPVEFLEYDDTIDNYRPPAWG